MFDIGFWELGLVGLVSLLVIGPQRLPGVVRLTGFWLGKTRRMVASVKQEIREELYAEEMRQSILDNSPKDELENLVRDLSETVVPENKTSESGTSKPDQSIPPQPRDSV